MGMQLLYGNDGGNYKTIAKSQQMSRAQEEVLKQRYAGYDVAAGEGNGLSASEKPVALSYVTSNLKNELPQEMVILSRQAAMSKDPSSYYAHFHLLDMSEEIYRDGFFDLLQFSYIEDTDISTYRESENDGLDVGPTQGSTPSGYQETEQEMLGVRQTQGSTPSGYQETEREMLGVRQTQGSTPSGYQETEQEMLGVRQTQGSTPSGYQKAGREIPGGGNKQSGGYTGHQEMAGDIFGGSQPAEDNMELTDDGSVRHPIDASMELADDGSVRHPIDASMELADDGSVRHPMDASMELADDGSVRHSMDTSGYNAMQSVDSGDGSYMLLTDVQDELEPLDSGDAGWQEADVSPDGHGNRQKKSIDSFAQRSRVDAPTVRQDAVGKDILLPIVAAVMDVAGTQRQVFVALDVQGNGYNQRALEVIAAVYSYLPYNMRKITSFSTYADLWPGGNESWANLQLCTREGLQAKENVIDLAYVKTEAILQKLPKDIVNFAAELIGMETLERKDWFQKFQDAFGLKAAKASDHIFLYSHINNWEQGDLTVQMDELALYASEEYNKEKKSLVFPVFCRIVSERFKQGPYNDDYQQRISKLLESQGKITFDRKLRAYLLLGESLEGVQFNRKLFLKWEQEKLIAPAEQTYKDMQFIDYLGKQYAKLCKCRMGDQKFQPVKNQMAQELENKKEFVKQEYEERIQKEADGIVAFFAEYNRSSFLPITQQHNQIQYEQNIPVFKQEMGVWYEKNLVSSKISTDKDYKSWLALLNKAKEYLEEETYMQLAQLLEEKGDAIREKTGRLTFRWYNKRSILDTYRKLPVDVKRLKEQGIKPLVCTLQFEENKCSMYPDMLETILMYLLDPTKKEQEKFKSIMDDKPGLLDELLTIHAFQAQHFPVLMQIANTNERKRVVEYYLREDVLLSREAVKQAIAQIAGDVRYLQDVLEAGDVADTILASVLKEQIEGGEEAPKGIKKFMGKFARKDPGKK